MTLELSSKLDRLYGVAVALCALLIIVAPKLVPISIIIFLIVTLVGYLKKVFVIKKMPKFLIALCILYLLYVIGIFFSSNLDVGLKYLEYKLSFIIFPLLFLVQPKKGVQVLYPIIGLLIGTIFISGYGLIKGAQCYLELEYFFDCFTASNLTAEHPTYFSVFLVMAMASVWYLNSQKVAFFNLIFSILLTCFFLFMMALSFAMAGLLFVFILIAVLFLVLIWKKFGRSYGLVTLFLGPIIVLVLLFKAPVLKDETANTWNSLKAYLSSPSQFVAYNEQHSGDDVRLIMWTASFNVLMKHPFGVGTGDVDIALSKELKAFGQTEFAKLDDKNLILYNPHNQYLQTANEIGIVGLLVLLFFIIGGIRYAIRTKNWLLLLLIANLAFNCIFESMLQRQSGIVFYSFWISMLVSSFGLTLVSKQDEKFVNS